jgi:hypothetical protein
MIEKIKKWWFRITHIKCDYCKEHVEEYYDAFLFSVNEYEGHRICIDCIKKLPNQKNIDYGKSSI